jgi:hypothetical protein
VRVTRRKKTARIPKCHSKGCRLPLRGTEFYNGLVDREGVTDFAIATGEHDVEISVLVDGTAGLDFFLRSHVYSDYSTIRNE